MVERRARAVLAACAAAVSGRAILDPADAVELAGVVRTAARVLPRGLGAREAARLESELERAGGRLAAYFELTGPAPDFGVGPGARRRIADVEASLGAAFERARRQAAAAERLGRLEAEAQAARGARPGGLRALSLRASCREVLEAGIPAGDARLLSCLFARRPLLEGEPGLAPLCALLGDREGAFRARGDRSRPSGLRGPLAPARHLADAADEALRARLAGRRLLVIAERPSLRRTGSLEALFEGAHVTIADPVPGGRFRAPAAALAAGRYELVIELARAGAGRQVELLQAEAAALPWVRVPPGISPARLVRELTLELVADPS